MTTDCHQIPNPQKSSRQQHEQQSCADIEHQQAREGRFSRRGYVEDLQRREPLTGLFLDAGWQCGHGYTPR